VKGLAGAIGATEANIGVEGPGEVLADIEEVVLAIELRFSLIQGVGAVEGVLGGRFPGFWCGFWARHIELGMASILLLWNDLIKVMVVELIDVCVTT
jgi:hypothetical protein